MALEPAAHIDQQRKAGRVTFRETVFPKTLNLAKDAFSKFLAVTALSHAIHNPLVKTVHAALALPRGHAAPQLIRLIGTEARGQDGNLHHLFLKYRHTEGSPQRLLQSLTRVADGFQS